MCSYNYYFILVETETSLHKDVKNRIKQIFFHPTSATPSRSNLLILFNNMHLTFTTLPAYKKTYPNREDRQASSSSCHTKFHCKKPHIWSTDWGEKQNSASSSNEVFVVRVLIRIVLDSQGFVRLDSPIV